LNKTCSKCEKCLPIEQFRVNARYADGHFNWCKGCEKVYRAEHYQRNRDKVRAQNAEWYAANKDKHNATSAANYRADPELHQERVKAAKARRPDHYRTLGRENRRKVLAERIDYRLRSRISSQFRYCLATGKGGRTSESLLRYSIDELRAHLERQFLKGMSWENMGQWHVDHIVPLASFTITGPDDPELRRAWALTNLRPLWAQDNMKKSAKREVLL
jgi:hypothetical protein